MQNDFASFLFFSNYSLQSSEEKERHEEVIIETSNEGLGMRVDENLYVIEITKQGPCDGKLLPGDHIIQVHFNFTL